MSKRNLDLLQNFLFGDWEEQVENTMKKKENRMLQELEKLKIRQKEEESQGPPKFRKSASLRKRFIFNLFEIWRGKSDFKLEIMIFNKI